MSGRTGGRARALVLGVAIALVALEVLLRVSGRGPGRRSAPTSDVPSMHEPDAELGWRNRPGVYVFGSEAPIRMTFWPDHTRATAPAPKATGRVIALIGDSFTQGWAVSDEDTFGWKLQAQRPNWRVRNLGSAGYGTTQSLLSLRRLLQAEPKPPEIVVYGFNDFHEGRNVAEVSWLRGLARGADQGHVAVPYATLDDAGALRLHPPARYPDWPLDRRSAVVSTLEGLWAEVAAEGRGTTGRAVTDRLLVELDRNARSAGSRLVVVTLSQWMLGSARHYKALFAEHGITFVDCRHPKFFAPEMSVPIYGHPNAAMNTHWAACIEAAIQRVAAPAT